MISRQDVIDNLINKPVYFDKPILKENNNILSFDIKNFLEIYSILIGTLSKSKEYPIKIILAGSKLLKQNAHIFWNNPNAHDDYYGTFVNRKIDCIFSIRSDDLDKLVDLVIMPTININN